MGTHDLRFLRHVFANLCFFDIINTIDDDIISGVLINSRAVLL